MSLHVKAGKTSRRQLRTLPFIADILALPTAIVRFPDSTMIGRVFGALAAAARDCKTSPIPDAKVFGDNASSASLSVLGRIGEPLVEEILLLALDIVVCEREDIIARLTRGAMPPMRAYTTITNKLPSQRSALACSGRVYRTTCSSLSP